MMSESKEWRVRIKFCDKIGNTATETSVNASVDKIMSRILVFESFCWSF